jgi:1,4-dihydroxy-2-naphthoate octaprenyltransferase
MNVKIKAHLWTLPRWFAAPFFGSAVIFGALLAGKLTTNSLLALIAGLLIMAGGHSFNSFLDYAWTGLDKGPVGERSAGKDYCTGQSLLADGVLSLREVLFNALGWYFLGAIFLIYLSSRAGWSVFIIGVSGMAVTFWYSKAKFNWTHELSLAIAVGPLSVLLGMFASVANPPWAKGLAGSVPFAITLSFAGLAMDEWPDAEANIKKGVKSIAYKVWEYGISLEWYIMSWLLFMFVYQNLLITLHVLAPLTGIAFVVMPFWLAGLVFMKKYFKKGAVGMIIVADIYLILLLIGQAFGK